MAILAQADLTAATNNLVYTAGSAVTLNILLCNRTTSAINATVWIVPNGTATPDVQHAIEYGVAISANGIIERGGIPLATGDQVFVNPVSSGVSCSIVGLPI